jgi:beta-lactamase class A TEM
MYPLETVTLINASIILEREEYRYSTFHMSPLFPFCGVLPSCFALRNAGENSEDQLDCAGGFTSDCDLNSGKILESFL